MSERNNSEETGNFGVFRYLLEIIGLILVCYICGCEWARDIIVRVVKDVRTVMQAGETDGSK